MNSKLHLSIAAFAAAFALASCGGGGASTASADAEKPAADTVIQSATNAEGQQIITDLLAWNHGRVTNWVWYDNPNLRPEDYEGTTGLMVFSPNQRGDIDPQSAPNPTNDEPDRRSGAPLAGLLDNYNRLRENEDGEDYVSWTNPINGIPLFIAVNSDTDYIDENRESWNSWTKENFALTGAVIRSVFGHGERSAFLQHGMFLCNGSDCNSSHFRAAIFGKRQFLSDGGDAAWSWLRRNGASATWRGAMAGSTVASGAAVTGQATVTYAVGNDSVGVQLTNIAQRADGTGVIEAAGGAYGGPSSFSWTLRGRNDSHSDYWYWASDETSAYGVDVRFYGNDAEEAAGTFEATYADTAIGGGRDKLVGGFVAKR